MAIQPFAALTIGFLTGVISVIGYDYITPFMSEKLRTHDTCGVTNLHGIPAVISAGACEIVEELIDVLID